MENLNISDEDIEFIEFAYSLINSAKYPSFTKVIDTYNKVFNKKINYTSCGQCLRQRILEMKKAVDKLNKEIIEDKNSDTMIGV